MTAYCLFNVGKLNCKDCVSCFQGKMPKLSFSSSTTLSMSPLELIHSDAWGPRNMFHLLVFAIM